jgi:transcriptional regulator with XRE-family HTH domain
MVELRIKEILKERKMTSKSLAEGMGKLPQYVSNVINGGKGVSINSLEEIARYLDVPISSLFADSKSNSGSLVCPHCGKEIRVKLE